MKVKQSRGYDGVNAPFRPDDVVVKDAVLPLRELLGEGNETIRSLMAEALTRYEFRDGGDVFDAVYLKIIRDDYAGMLAADHPKEIKEAMIRRVGSLIRFGDLSVKFKIALVDLLLEETPAQYRQLAVDTVKGKTEDVTVETVKTVKDYITARRNQDGGMSPSDAMVAQLEAIDFPAGKVQVRFAERFKSGSAMVEVETAALSQTQGQRILYINPAADRGKVVTALLRDEKLLSVPLDILSNNDMYDANTKRREALEKLAALRDAAGRDGGITYGGMEELIGKIKEAVLKEDARELEKLSNELLWHQQNEIIMECALEGKMVNGLPISEGQAAQIIKFWEDTREVPGILNGFKENMSFDDAIKAMEAGDYSPWSFKISSIGSDEEAGSLLVMLPTVQGLAKRYHAGEAVKDGGSVMDKPNHRLYVGKGNTVEVRYVYNGAYDLTATIPAGGRVNALDLDLPNSRLYIGTDRGVEVWSVYYNQNERIGFMQTRGSVHTLRLDLPNSKLYVYTGRGQEVWSVYYNRNELISRHDGGQEVGGIDFRRLPAQAVNAAPGVPAMDIAAIKALAGHSKMANLDKEWAEIEKCIRTSQMPTEKVKEFVAVCSVRQGSSGQLAKAQEAILAMIKMEEACAVETSAQERELLVMLESI